jgi:hypothetical protein
MDCPKPDNPLSMRLDQFGLCWLELCGYCPRIVFQPLPMLADGIGGAVLLGDLLPLLRCEACDGKPSVMALVQRADGQAFGQHGPPIGWRIVLVCVCRRITHLLENTHGSHKRNRASSARFGDRRYVP